MESFNFPEKCNINANIEFFSKKHMLKIVGLLSFVEKPLRFSEICNILDLNTKTLSQRLKDLEKANLITRYSFDEVPPRVVYQITPEASILPEIFVKLGKLNINYSP